jgi:hypothetical protein
LPVVTGAAGADNTTMRSSPVVVSAAAVLAAGLMVFTAPRVPPVDPGLRLAAASAPLEIGTGIPTPVRIAATPDGQGFYVLASNGSVHAYGDAVHRGDAQLPHPAVAMAVTGSGGGYWVFDANGCTQAFGDAATFSASVCGKTLNGPILDAAATPTGRGYWLVASDGGIFAFGDATFRGSMGGVRLNAPVVGMAPGPGGYWEVASDGGIFAFGVPFKGSMGATRLNRPVAGMVASGAGYLMVGADGGAFNFGNPFFGSLGASPPMFAVIAVAPSYDHSGAPNGYWMLDRGGETFGFGSAWMPSGAAPPSSVTAPTLTPAATPAYADDAPDPDLVRNGSTWYTFTTGTTWGNNLGVLTSMSPTSGWHTVSGKPYGSTAIGAVPGWERPGTQTSPGVYQWKGRWVMFYDAIDTRSGKYCLSVATSSSPATPFADTSQGSLECQADLGGSIDPSPFVDASGQPWLYWKSNDGSSLSVSDVWAAPLAADGMSLAGAPQIVMAKDSVDHPWENTVDDPQMVLANGRYLLFFTGGDWQSAAYATGFAVCAGPTGPCTQPQAGPILSSYGPAAGPGGGSLASDGNGNWFMAYAAWSPGCTNYGCGGKRLLYVAPISLP